MPAENRESLPEKSTSANGLDRAIFAAWVVCALSAAVLFLIDGAQHLAPFAAAPGLALWVLFVYRATPRPQSQEFGPPPGLAPPPEASAPPPQESRARGWATMASHAP